MHDMEDDLSFLAFGADGLIACGLDWDLFAWSRIHAVRDRWEISVGYKHLRF